MFLVVGISIALFLSFILLSKRGKTIADKILAVWLIVSATHLGFYYYHISAWMLAIPQLIGWAIPIALLHGPFLFVYTQALTQPAAFKHKRWLIHFLPALLLYLYISPFLFSPAGERLAAFKSVLPSDVYFKYFHPIVLIGSGFLYSLWAAWLLRRHKRGIAHRFSNIERINLDWLSYLIYSLAGLWILVAYGNDDLIFSAAVLYILFIGYFGIKQVGIFTEKKEHTFPEYAVQPETGKAIFSKQEESIEIDEDEIIEKKKYQKSGLSEEQAAQTRDELSELMATEKLYKNSELTLADLAARLDIHPNYLSQVINDKEGVNFYEYINALRVEEFKRLTALPENRQFTLLSLAYDCGFNSKSSFNRAFKKVTDHSPSEYLKAQV
jgi:AraC-like DNA-binding protein